MKKYKLILPIVVLLYLSIGAFFLLPTFSADETDSPTIPTIFGFSNSQMYMNEDSMMWAVLYNPPLDEAVNPYVGEKTCSVETSLTFPKDLLEVSSVNFATNDSNTYSNEAGTINFKADLVPCTTITWINLFDVTFKTKQVGQGVIRFTKSIVKGGSDGTTVLQSGILGDISVDVVPPYQYEGEKYIIDKPLPDIETDLPQPEVQPVTKTNPKSSTNSSSSSASAKTASKTENSAFATPALTKLEFGANAVLDKANGNSLGAVFTGTAEPNSKVYILIHSQTEIYTDTTSAADGTWNKIIDSALEDGSHTITVWAEKDNKISPKFSSPFVISSYAKDQIAIGETYPEFKGNGITDTKTKKKETGKLTLLMKNKFFLIYLGAGIILIAFIIVMIVKSRRNKNDSSGINGGGADPNLSISSQQNIPAQANQQSRDTIYPNTEI